MILGLGSAPSASAAKARLVLPLSTAQASIVFGDRGLSVFIRCFAVLHNRRDRHVQEQLEGCGSGLGFGTPCYGKRQAFFVNVGARVTSLMQNFEGVFGNICGDRWALSKRTGNQGHQRQGFNGSSQLIEAFAGGAGDPRGVIGAACDDSKVVPFDAQVIALLPLSQLDLHVLSSHIHRVSHF
jgi:hypothetical protein